VKVLIADDDRLVRAMLTDLLAGLGHSVVEAANGVEAVALCGREAPDLLILDLLMPRLSGLDALRQLRERGVRTPMVLLSAISDGSVRALEGAEAIDVLLEKPVTARSLARALERAVRSVR
jgi:CheY-like chemotaxis protein